MTQTIALAFICGTAAGIAIGFTVSVMLTNSKMRTLYTENWELTQDLLRQRLRR